MKSTYQIAAELVDAMPLRLGTKSSQKMLLVGMITEKLDEQRQQGYGDAQAQRDSANGHREGMI